MPPQSLQDCGGRTVAVQAIRQAALPGPVFRPHGTSLAPLRSSKQNLFAAYVFDLKNGSSKCTTVSLENAGCLCAVIEE